MIYCNILIQILLYIKEVYILITNPAGDYTHTSVLGAVRTKVGVDVGYRLSTPLQDTMVLFLNPITHNKKLSVHMCYLDCVGGQGGPPRTKYGSLYDDR